MVKRKRYFIFKESDLLEYIEWCVWGVALMPDEAKFLVLVWLAICYLGLKLSDIVTRVEWYWVENQQVIYVFLKTLFESKDCLLLNT